jgi:hypothetical protein
MYLFIFYLFILLLFVYGNESCVLKMFGYETAYGTYEFYAM